MDQLLVALDVESGARAMELASSLRGLAGGFKIGSRLFTLEGPAVVRALTDRGDRVFLDLKFHDIPHTVATAVAAATSLGVWMLNIHASGGGPMMQAAINAARDTAAKRGCQTPLVIAVTVLTSMNAATLSETGVHGSVLDQVARLAQLTQAAGLDGVVASAQETSLIRETCGPDFAIVTPGIRGGSAVTSGHDDQERTMTAPEAIAAGASYIVVGRPIIAASDPRAAAERIVADLRPWNKPRPV
ncbi:MAG: orotidine-5'-phosphate decarboxylase [Vicinamibacterales bacterium]